MSLDTERDLEISRIIKAPRAAIWAAWTMPEQFAQWWVPGPAQARVVRMELRPGGAMETQISEDGGPWAPHMDACYLDLVEGRRLVFTNALTGGWRPAEQPFITAIITLDDHDLGTAYRAVVMHKSPEDRAMHKDMGFFDGWGAVTEQLARLVER